MLLYEQVQSRKHLKLLGVEWREEFAHQRYQDAMLKDLPYLQYAYLVDKFRWDLFSLRVSYCVYAFVDMFK